MASEDLHFKIDTSGPGLKEFLRQINNVLKLSEKENSLLDETLRHHEAITQVKAEFVEDEKKAAFFAKAHVQGMIKFENQLSSIIKGRVREREKEAEAYSNAWKQAEGDKRKTEKAAKDKTAREEKRDAAKKERDEERAKNKKEREEQRDRRNKARDEKRSAETSTISKIRAERADMIAGTQGRRASESFAEKFVGGKRMSEARGLLQEQGRAAHQRVYAEEIKKGTSSQVARQLAQNAALKITGHGTMPTLSKVLSSKTGMALRGVGQYAGAFVEGASMVGRWGGERIMKGQAGYQRMLGMKHLTQNLQAYSGQGPQMGLGTELRNQARRSALELGIDPEQAMGMLMQAKQAGGGAINAGSAGREMKAVANAGRLFGVNAGTSGRILRGGQLGGLSGKNTGGPEVMARMIGDAVAMGLEGSEINQYLEQTANTLDDFKQTGIPVDAAGMRDSAAMMRGLGLGATQATFGAQQTQSEIRGMIKAGGPRGSAMDLLRLKHYGGADFTRGGVGIDELYDATVKMKTGQTAKAKIGMIKDLMRVGGRGAGMSLKGMAMSTEIRKELGTDDPEMAFKLLTAIDKGAPDAQLKKIMDETQTSMAKTKSDMDTQGARAGDIVDEDIQRIAAIVDRQLGFGERMKNVFAGLQEGQQIWIEQATKFRSAAETYVELSNEYKKVIRTMTAGGSGRLDTLSVASE